MEIIEVTDKITSANDITILPELAALLPGKRSKEIEMLREDIIKNGCEEPLVAWFEESTGRHILVDGHCRFDICTNTGHNFVLVYRNFASLTHAKSWLVDRQLMQRNLTKQQWDYLVGVRCLLEQKKHGDIERIGASGQNDHLRGGTAKGIGEKNGISEKTVRRNAKYAQAIDKLTSPARGADLGTHSQNIQNLENLGVLKAKLLNHDIPISKTAAVNLAEMVDGNELAEVQDQLLSGYSADRILEQIKQADRAIEREKAAQEADGICTAFASFEAEADPKPEPSTPQILEASKEPLTLIIPDAPKSKLLKILSLCGMTLEEWIVEMIEQEAEHLLS